MPLLQRPDAAIHYEEYGSGAPVVLTYGLAGNTRLWEPQIEAFSKLYRLILWDQRGHGKSTSPLNPDAYGVWQSVEDAAALLDALSIARAHMGGGTACRPAQEDRPGANRGYANRIRRKNRSGCRAQ